jgi:hypothetical protein
MADAMKTRWRHMQQEAIHELLGLQDHRFVARATVLAVVLPKEGDAAFI